MKRGTQHFYFEDGLTIRVERRTSESKADLLGKMNEFTTSSLVTISGKPAPMIANLSGFYTHGVNDVGTSIFGAVDTPLEIWSKTEGQKRTWARSGQLRAPGLMLSATKDFFNGEISWACLGGSSTEPTDAAHFNVKAAQVFTATDFDPTKNRRFRYTAAYGADLDLQAITAAEGFAIDVNFETAEILDDNVGIADIDLASISATIKFTPSNLDEEAIWSLLRLQGADALLPGEAIGNDLKDLVISGEDSTMGFTATLKNVGFKTGGVQYATSKLRGLEIEGATARTYTGSTADPIFTFTITAP